MAQLTIGIGSSANDGTGDPLRTAFDKINDNTIETEITWKADDRHEITGGFQFKDVSYDLGIGIGIETQDTVFNFSPLGLKNKTKKYYSSMNSLADPVPVSSRQLKGPDHWTSPFSMYRIWS